MHPPMRVLRLLCRESARLVQHARDYSEKLRGALIRRRQQPALDALEAERIDRIRNPGKYRGKS
jgi:hypothetical protein